MFFIFGITSKRDDLDFGETRICSVCGRYGRYNVFVEYIDDEDELTEEALKRLQKKYL